MSVLCLVPTAQRAARVARRLCDAQGGVLLGARVATLDAAAALVLAGGERRPVLSPLAERLLCADAARASPLFAEATQASGVLRALRACVSELRQAEVGSEDLRSAARGANGSVGTRLESLAAVLAAYEERLERHGALDAAAALRAAAERLEGRAAPGEELRELDLLVIDGFVSLPPAALDLALGLTRRARRAQWRIPYFGARAELSAVAEPLVRRIEALHHVGGRSIDLALEDVDGDGRAGRLAAALHRVFGAASGAAAVAGGGRIFLAAGAGEHGEAEAAAAFLSRLLEGGFAPDEVALIAASGASAERTCRAAEALHLPLNGRPRAPLADHPPVQAILAALEAAARPRRSALEAVLASPYLVLSRVPARVGYWLDRAGATDDRGDPRGALRRRADALTSPRAAQERSALLRVSDALTEASRELSRIGGPATAREQAARLRGFLARSGLRRHAGRGAPDVARRDLEAIARLEDLADDVVRSLSVIGRGAEVLDAATWRDLLATAADHVTLSPPRDAALGIEVSAVADAPGLSARAAVVVGCERGAFPEAPTRDPLLGDAERLAIDAVLRRPALASSATKLARARHAAFAALAAAREVLCVAWSGPGPSGTGRGPAAAVSELSPLVEPVDAGPGALPPARRSEGSAIRADAEGALQGRLAVTGERVASVVARAAVEAERRASVDARAASRFAGAIPEAVRGAFQALLPRQWTPSQLEDHARCPFRFFVGTVLAATEPAGAEPDIDPRDEGSLAHAVLERFYRERIAAGRPRLLGTPDEVEELSAAARAVFASFEADGRTGDPAVWASRRGAVRQRLEAVLAEEAHRRDDAVPALVEHRFGGEGGAPPLVFTDGTLRVELRGRIDRVDASDDRIVLLDYKDSRSGTRWREKLQRPALGAVNFQVPAYLMAAARALPGRARLEATYLLLRSAERLAPVVLEAGDPLLATDERARAEARAAGERPFADAVLSTVAAIRDGVLPIASRDCRGCAFGAVCRFPARAEEEP